MPGLRSLLRWRIRRAKEPFRRVRRRHYYRRARAEFHADRWANALQKSDRRWFPGGTPPRQHNRVTPLIDGANYFRALHEAIGEAQHYIYVIGWCATPYFPLGRECPEDLVATRLHRVLAEAARRVPVRILLWGGARFVFQPDQHTAEQVRDALHEAASGLDLRCVLDLTARLSHCHHQKAIVVDGRIAFLGGMDLTTFQGDRWDTPAHPLRAGPNWHDAQVRIEGEAVADVEHNFRQRWQAVTGDDMLPHCDPLHEASWNTPLQIVRTIPAHTYRFAPHGEFGIHHIYTRLIRGAQRLIYLENQYLWSPEILEALIAALNRTRESPFRIAILLPARAYDGKWDNDQHVEELRKADGGRGIVSVYAPYTSGPGSGMAAFRYRPVYVHAKVAVIDDEWLLIGSANLNDRGLATDSEIMAAMHDSELARRVRVDLWTEHLAMPRSHIEQQDPIALLDNEWQERAAENERIIRSAERPLLCALHTYKVGKMPGEWLLEEGETLTVEH